MIQQMQRPCDLCKGQGESVNINDKCSNCNGQKVILENNQYEFKIEPGAPDGAQLVIRNEGNYDVKAKERSNVLILINLEDQKIFTRNDNDLILSFIE